MPDEKNQLNHAVIIGSTGLCVACAEHLLESGWNILGIVSDDSKVIEWSKKSNIQIMHYDNYLKHLANRDIAHYLFSIINSKIIPEHILSHENIKLALNYHDSLLPKYAGLHSTTWAIENKEQTHGVTWHKITPGIDEGDIALQQEVPIRENDTAYSLNLRCTEEALNVFEKLIYQIEKNTLIFTEQDLSQRTYYGNAHLKNKTLSEIFEINAAISPYRIALEYDNEKLTFEQLNKYSNQFARTIIKQYKNITHDTLIPICFEKGLNMVIAILAILKTGAAYVPIHPDTPPLRKNHIIKECNHNILIDEVFIKKNNCSIEKYHNLNIQQDRNNLAYVIYTSGTTGNPKGVMVSHKACINTIFSKITEQFEKGSFWCDYVFDVSVFELFSGLLKGATVCIIPEECRYDPEMLGEWLIKNKIQQAYIPKHALETLSKKQYSHLKSIYMGGESIMGDEVEGFLKQSIRICNGYGLTETGITSTCFITDTQDSVQYNKNIPIGKPINNTEAYILDENNQICDIEKIGALYLSGIGLAEGYLNQSELTQEKFITHPTISNKILFKTGDKAKRLANGNLVFMGRTDGQIKINGHRIELEEIEMTIQKHKDIARACVIQDKNSLFAFYISKNKIESNILRKYVQSWLPTVMIPNKFIPIDSFPINTSGKINRIELLELIEKEKTPEVNKVDILNYHEQQLLPIWQEIFNNKAIDSSSNFFELGGDSLLAVQLAKRISKDINCQIRMTDVFYHPSIQELSMLINQQPT